MELIHGGDVAGFLEEYGVKPLDFSANINPLGMPEGARQAVIQALEQADQYPDPLCREPLPLEKAFRRNGFVAAAARRG